MALLAGEGLHRGGVTDRQAETVVRPGPGDVSDGLFTIQGEHDDVAARDVCANRPRPTSSSASTSTPAARRYNAGSVTGYDTDRPFSAQNLRLATLVQTDVLDAMNAQGWGIPDLGVADDSQLGGPALSTRGGRLRAPVAARPGRPGLVRRRRARCRARSSSRSSSPIPSRAAIAASASGQQVIAGGLAQAIEQYFAPPPATAKNSEDGGRASTTRTRPPQRRPAA